MLTMPLTLDTLRAQSGTIQRSPQGFPELPEDANPHPDGNRILTDSMRAEANHKMQIALNVQRQKEMTSETAKLVALAAELKTATEKADAQKLSVLELRKAELIAKLAHSVHDKMTAEFTPN